MKKTLYIFLFCVSFAANAQVVFEPLYRNVYSYLSRIAQRGVIELDDVVLPIPRTTILNHLLYLKANQDKITPLEKKELVFYLREYQFENKILTQDSTLKNESKVMFLKNKKGDRLRFLASQDKQFSINFQPIYGYKFAISDGQSDLVHRWSGFWVNGYIGKNFGYSFDFRGHNESGIGVDETKKFTSETGHQARKTIDGIEYSDIKATISYSWKWGALTVGKDYMPVGYGSNGKIILSTKATSFPLIRLDAKPVKWFNFNYAHIWLNSNVLDSTKIRASGIPGVNQVSDVPKYLATHSLIFTPFKGLKLLLGESIVYNNQVQLAYMMPIMFFRAYSHYQGELTRDNTVSNSQIFTQISSRNHIPHTHIYGSFYVDELSLRNAKNRNQTAYNVGVSITDFPFRNIFLSSDYTRIRPFAYIHFLPMQTYQNNGFNLGHWLGPNSDQFRNEIQYRIARGLDLKLIHSQVRKGTEGTGVEQRNDLNENGFLWGDLMDFKSREVIINYEIIHDFFLKVGYQNLKIDNKKESAISIKNSFSLSANYGF